ncbi:MAG: zinc-dependent alcohol dehydrogenase family protein [Firmicutes bacterium]|nr:zinc-dependent alcohol dehydrogenase family protein [Bacillota bacterium]
MAFSIEDSQIPRGNVFLNGNRPTGDSFYAYMHTGAIQIESVEGEDMIAARFMDIDDLQLVEEDVPKPGPGEVLIKVKAAGICGTDAHILKGESASTPPVILGHEYAGEVVELGEGVTGLHQGDRISVDPNMFCHTCYYCHSGKEHLCLNLTALGVDIDGGFAEYAVVPEVQAHLLPPSVDFTAGAFIEPVACCIRGLQQAHIQPGDEVAILGGGPIGLILLQLAVAAGGRVTVSEPVQSKWSLAKALGAGRTVLPEELPDDAFDIVIEAAGIKATVEQSVQVARRGASIVWFGVSPQGLQAAIEPHEVFRKELHISGSFINPHTHARAVKLVGTGAVRVEPLVSHRFPLTEIDEALRVHASGHANKVMIIPE